MKITEHRKRKTGKVYWVFDAETEHEKFWLRSVGLKPSKFGNSDGTKFYGNDAELKDRAIREFTVIPEVNTEPNDNSEGEEMSAEEIKELSMQELRKRGAEKAKAEGRPTTDLRTKWSRDQIAEYLMNGTWAEVNAGPVAMPTPGSAGADAFGQMMAMMISPYLNLLPDPDLIEDIIKEEIQKAAKVIKVELPTGEVKDMGRQHYLFEKLVKLVMARENFSLVGPAGSGKTHAVHAAAEANGLNFYCISVGQQTTKTDLIGFIDATGNYHRTQLRDAIEHGGVFLMDEADAGNANTITIMNAMTSNGFAPFPDGMVEVNADFVCVMAMNTYGRGADRQYVGRNKLDGATLDRFAVIDFDYDEELEVFLAGNTEWAKTVQRYRKAAWDTKQEIIISPRASIKGAKLLAAGFPRHEVEEMVIWKGVSQDIRSKITAHC
jgi:MoxR-like ATPase